ncbi:MAG TPA: acyl-CoA dehydrogenase [Polyangiaceae bacterium]
MIHSLTSSPYGDPSPFYDDRARHLVGELDRMKLGEDEALHDVARVAARLGALGLYEHLDARGRGLAATHLCAIREQLGFWSPLADSVYAVQGLCMYPLALTKRDDLVAQMARGEKIGGFGLTEPEAGSDVASMKTTARRDGSSWILNGQKTLISNVGIAHHFVVFANANPEAGKKGISAFLLPADATGVELARIELSGEHPLGKISMTDVRLPEDALLGTVGQGLSLALGTLGLFRISVGAAANGMAWRAIEETIRHVRTREQGGKKLAELQLVQAHVAEMTTDLAAARLLVASAAHHHDSHPTMAANVLRANRARRAAMAKMTATENAQKIIDAAVQLHGGMGVALGTKVEELYREIRPLRIYEGATDILKLVIAGAVLG